MIKTGFTPTASQFGILYIQFAEASFKFILFWAWCWFSTSQNVHVTDVRAEISSNVLGYLMGGGHGTWSPHTWQCCNVIKTSPYFWDWYCSYYLLKGTFPFHWGTDITLINIVPVNWPFIPLWSAVCPLSLGVDPFFGIPWLCH